MTKEKKYSWHEMSGPGIDIPHIRIHIEKPMTVKEIREAVQKFDIPVAVSYSVGLIEGSSEKPLILSDWESSAYFFYDIKSK